MLSLSILFTLMSSTNVYCDPKDHDVCHIEFDDPNYDGTITLPEVVIVGSVNPSAEWLCGPPRALLTDPTMTVKECEYRTVGDRKRKVAAR